MPKFSVIIPVYNEEKNIRRCVEHVRGLGSDIEIIIVDGSSQDDSYNVSASLGAQVYRSKKGRGYQMNEGAKNAAGKILIFLHADSLLPDDMLIQLEQMAQNPDIKAGTFRMGFDSDHWAFRLYAYFTRYDSIWTSFGDQGIVVRKDFYDEMGGFPEWPIFEDVHFLRLARRKTKIHSFPGPIITSARKFHNQGIFQRQWHNGVMILKYLMGKSPDKLYEEYYHEKPA